MSIIARRKRAEKTEQRTSRARRARPTRPALCALSLPEDVLTDDVRLTLEGNARLLVENHCGILDVRDECVRLQIRRGRLEIEGEGLFLRDARPSALAVEGKIVRLSFCREE